MLSWMFYDEGEGRAMDQAERLRLLKRERAFRTKAARISKTWLDIDKDVGVSTKEKLERLIRLTGSPPVKKERPAVSSIECGKKKPLQVFENSFDLRSRYGKIPIAAGLGISGEVLALLSRDRSFAGLDLSTALFLDLETTGLSGGVGVVPFLIGLGYFQDDRFQVSQFFLGDLAEEGNLIRELGRFFGQVDFRSLVTFNGKAFDLPLLETRFILQREALPLSGLPHLDFLFSARSLWSHKHESCRLYHLAQQILEADREEDIPSAEIPDRYFQFLRTGDLSLIEPVLYHNQEDLLSLLGVVISGAALFSEQDPVKSEVEADAMDLFGAARLLERTGQSERSALFMRRALEGRLSSEIAVLAKMKLAAHFKKNRDWTKAVSLWQEMTEINPLTCYRELAIYYEHRERDYEKARQVAAEGLTAAAGISGSLEKDFTYRLDRLQRKLGRKKREQKSR
jgi:uncharacterized protein YprB with RNaseH-like and TPR domain